MDRFSVLLQRISLCSGSINGINQRYMTDTKALYSQELVLILTGCVLDGCHGTAHVCIVYFQLCVEEKRHHPRLAALHCQSHSYKRCGTSKAAHVQRRKMGGSAERQVWPAESPAPLSLILSSWTRGSSWWERIKDLLSSCSCGWKSPQEFFL